MFGFLKEKLKSWLGKSKKDIEVKVKEKSKKEKSKQKIEKIREKPIKPEKRKRTKEELKSERKITENIREDMQKEGLEIKSPEQKLEDLSKEKQLEEIKEIEVEQIQTDRIGEASKKNLGALDKEKKQGFFSRIRKFFSYNITKEDFDEIFSELEIMLLESNVALEVVEKLKADLEKDLVGKEIKKDELENEITSSLKKALEEILIEPENTITEIKDFRKISKEPYKILFFGVNGAGKTTSIAKFAHLCLKNKLSVILAAADTFRAASIEQLQIHADKLGVKMIKHDYNSDPSAVAFDAIKYAKQNNIDVVLIDTAGRMHTKTDLLREMEKISRVTKPDLKIFVAEAVAGNDATEQAKAFNELIGVDGSILSKVDVDEKGGTILSIGFITKKPILYLGLGQNYEDIKLFSKKEFLKNLGL